MSTTTPVIIAVAPNGARKLKADHPALPLTPLELAKEARACLEEGTSLMHLHIRNPDGSHSISPEYYRPAIEAIRKEVGDGLIIQATSEACGIFSPAEQMAMVRDLRPEAVSLAVKELIPDSSHEKEAAAFLSWVKQERIMPQYILYSQEELRRFVDLRNRGVIPGEKHYVLFVLGRYSAGQTSSPSDLLPFLQVYEELKLHGRIIWAVCAFGKQEGACMLASTLMEGNVRIGFENNLYLSDGSVAPNNAALIRQYVGALGVTNRNPATTDEARQLLAGTFL